MSFLGWLFIFLFPTAPAFAGDSCFALKDVQEVQQKITLDEDFKPSDLCNPATPSYKLMEVLILLKNIRVSDNDVPEIFNQHILKDEFWSYFSVRAKSFTNIPGGEACKGVLAMVLGALRDGNIYLCPSFYEESTLPIERAAVLLHEVRHFEGHSHALCERGPNKNARACDGKFSDQGSYAVSAEAFAKMSASPMLDAKNRAYGKQQLLLFAEYSFNTPIRPLNNEPTTAVYVSSSEGKAFIFDGRTLYPANPVENAKVISRLSGLVVIPNDKSISYTMDLFSKDDVRLIPQDGFLQGYNKDSQAERPEIIDILRPVENVMAFITPEILMINVSPMKAPSLVRQSFLPEELGLPASESFYIRDDQRNLFRVKWENGVNTAKLTAKVWDLDFEPKALVAFQKERLALTHSGEVLVNKDGEWKIHEALKGLQVQSLSRPFLWQSSLYK